MTFRNPLHWPFAGALASLLAVCGAGPAFGQALDPLMPVTNGVVHTTAISGDRLYLGGAFSYVGPRTGSFALLNSAAMHPSVRPPEVNGPVNAMVEDGEGGWYIGGLFSRVAGVPRSNGAHIRADGTLDAWDPGTNGPIECMLAAPEGIYIGGSFVNLGGEPSPNLGLVNRTTAASLHWTPTPDSVVRALATDGTNLFVAGRFRNINGVVRRGFAVVTKNQVVTPIDLNLNGTSNLFIPDIHALAYSAGKLYMGGVLISVSGTSRLGAAAISTSNGALTSWSPNADSRVRALLLARGRVYLGGDFSSVGPVTAVARQSAAAVDTLTGAPAAWNPVLGAGSRVHTIHDDGALLYVGGSFTTAAGAAVRNLIATDDAGNRIVSAPTPTNGTVRALAHVGSRVYVGGQLTSLGGEIRNNVAAVSLSSGALQPWNPSVTNGIVRTLAVAPGRVYLGGTFSNVSGTARAYAAAVDSANALLLPWNPAPDSSVRAIVANGGSVYVGGHFRNCGGLARKLVALVNSTNGVGVVGFDCPLGRVNESPTTTMYVQTIVLSGPKLYLSGLFDRVRPGASTIVRNRACAVNSATGALLPWNPSLDGDAHAIVPTASGVFAGGSFTRTTNQGVITSSMLFDTLGVDQPSFQAFTGDTTVNAILVSGSTFIAGGGLFNVGLSNRNGLGSANWNTGISTAWNPSPDVRDVRTLIVDPATNDLIVGGGFEMMGANRAFGLARFKGTLPSTPAVTVTAPLPGTSLDLGNTFRIEWTSSAGGPGIQSADVYVSQSGVGGPFRLLAAGIVGRNSLDWVLDNSFAPSTNNFVRVDVRDWYGTVTSDLTNASFNTFVDVVTGVDPGAQAAFALRPLVPNPVRGAVRVNFVAPRAARVTLSVHDVQGRTLTVLANGEFAAGSHDIPMDAAALPPGLCFVRLHTPTGTLTQRFVTLH